MTYLIHTYAGCYSLPTSLILGYHPTPGRES